jgi:hypothetical protein
MKTDTGNEDWEKAPWDDKELRYFLKRRTDKQKALLKVLTDAGGELDQGSIMGRLPFLKTRPEKLRAVKAGLSKACESQGRMRIVPVGPGLRDASVHQINPALGELRQVLIEEAKRF